MPFLPRGRIALLLAVGIAASLSEGLGLLLLVPLLELATGGGATRLSAFPAMPLNVLLVLFVVLVTLRSLLVQWRLVMETRTHLQVSNALRDALFRAILQADWRYLAAMRQGNLLSLTTSLADRAGSALQFLLGLAAAMFTLASMLGAAMLIAPLPALVVGSGGALVLALYSGMRRRAAQHGTTLSGHFAAFHDFYTERFDALRVIKSLGKSAEEAARGRAIAEELAKAQVRYQASAGLSQIVLQAGAATALAGAVWLALDHWQVPAVTLLPLIALFARSVPLFASVQMGWQNYLHHAEAAREIESEIAQARLHAEPIADPGTPAARLTAQVRLDEVTVRFEGRDRPSLDRISLTIPAGSMYFLTGPSGSGKSTLADLLAGLTRPDGGAISIDGQVLEGPAWAAWRNSVAYVQQEPLLFDATLRENLLWAAPDADEARLRDCLTRGAANFVFDLPEGLDTRVGTSGRQLSGGERQRIVLARALLRDPQLLILDEATSALDRENEARIVEAVTALKGSVTVVVIGHGGQLAQQADQTVKLENGAILG